MSASLGLFSLGQVFSEGWTSFSDGLPAVTSYNAAIHALSVIGYIWHYGLLHIRESVDSLCRDGADTLIGCVDWKAFLTGEHSCSEPFWALSTAIPMFLLPNNTPGQVAKMHP